MKGADLALILAGVLLKALAAWLLFAQVLSSARVIGIGVIIVGCWLVARS
ncbi:MAG TPA: hypothetical protein VNZ06_11930 [Steroidobacteraceae bacterium]|jgi:drug/metabolite transporter (DMT)-like permease|nr:hypothetical protein [Steroidobacteraceae bacterium]